MADRENLSRLWQLGLTGVSMESIRRGTTCLKNEHSCYKDLRRGLSGTGFPSLQLLVCFRDGEEYGVINSVLSLHVYALSRFTSGFHLMVTDSSPSVVQQPLCHGSDSSALLEFKQSFLIEKFASGDPSAYPKVEMWQPEREGSDCCSWDGVECDTDNGHVIGLDLSSSCLYGSINSSSSLFRLVHLLRLDLSDNDFNYSKIPHGVGQLSRLTSLNLSSSRFSGQISSQILELSKLVFLDLSSNPLHLHKPNLRNLVVNLTQLKKLHLNEVNISSRVPDVFANLSSLTSLLLENCGLHGEFPTGIFHLSSLQFLSVRNNPDLTGLFPEFHHTSSLKLLALAGTSFSGRLPTSIGNLDSLVELNISSCNFTSGLIASSLGRLIQLTSLDLSRNSFSGQIPSLQT
ncbi:Receptor like protein 30 [Vitis vinifera]|uniref:Receptor like protein 30 n=1 Tax=Vitis vinifera TaxID=29760 RepID=A0A438IEL2_VITVI|nr:Receptor like protein 30 [Vitis vinifera]